MVDFAFLDSGTGGIPYLVHLLKKSPSSVCVYVGDNKNFPYGEKTHEQIVKCVLLAVEKIINRFDPKVIVIACNTMSVNTLDVLREIYPERQFVGTVPAIKLASSISKKRRLGLLATKATCEHPYNIDLKNHFASDCELVLRPDPELISFIEHKSYLSTKQECENALMPAIDFFIKNDCDAIILGCTHFLNLAELFQEVCDKKTNGNIRIVDSREGVTKRALSLLSNMNLQQANLLQASLLQASLLQTDSNQSDLPQLQKKEPKLYITADSKDKEEYDVICKRFGLEFGNLL